MRDGTGHGWVLIVEDDEMVARASGMVFAQNAAVEIAGSVRAALVAIERPGLVGALVDVGLPDGSGFEVVEAMRTRFPHVDIRVWSGRLDPGDVARAGALGIAYLAKGADVANVAWLAARWGKEARELDLDDPVVERRIVALAEQHALSEKQTVVRLVARGLNYAEIAAELGISRKAVEQLAARIRNNTGRSPLEWAAEACAGTRRTPRRPRRE